MSPHNKELSPPAGWRVPPNVQALFMFRSFWTFPSARDTAEKLHSPPQCGRLPQALRGAGSDGYCEHDFAFQNGNTAVLEALSRRAERFSQLRPLSCETAV